MISKRLLLGSSMGGALALLGFVSGCNSPSGSGEAAAGGPVLPTVAIAADEPAPPKDPAAQTEITPDADYRAIISQLNEQFKAADQDNPFDFGPAAARLSKNFAANGLTVMNFGLARDVTRSLEVLGAYEPARVIYTALNNAAAKGGRGELPEAASEIAKLGLKRLDLLGTKPKIEGTIFGGEKFDWSKYSGKVVMLDFWATWCGPCMKELPNVKKAYEKLHDPGFEIVGITLDDDKDKLAAFLEKDKLPWTTLFDSNSDKQGFEIPLAKEFGVDGIPATYLVDRSGKIVSISARGELLQSQLEKLLAEKK